jgi:hypothetical protein
MLLRMFLALRGRWRKFLLEFVALNIPDYITDSKVFVKGKVSRTYGGVEV